MYSETTINFESEFLKRFTSSKKYKYSFIGKLLIILFVSLYITLFINPKAQNISNEIKIALVTTIFTPILIYIATAKFISKITFEKTKDELTINYYQFFKLKHITTSIDNIEYFIYDMKESLYNKRRTNFLKIILFKELEFSISSSNVKNSGLDYDEILKFFNEIGLKKYKRDFLLEDELDKTL
jgi:hypothetical protein